MITDNDEQIVEPGYFELSIAGGQRGFCSSTSKVVSEQFEIIGDVLVINNFAC